MNAPIILEGYGWRYGFSFFVASAPNNPKIWHGSEKERERQRERKREGGGLKKGN